MLRQINERLWFLEADHRSDRPALGYIRGSRMALAVDAGASQAHVELFYNELRAAGLPLPAFTGISHYHWDHSYGAAFVHGASFASDRCADRLRQEAAWKWTPEDMKRRLDEGEDILFGHCSKLAEYPDPSAIRVAAPDIALHGDADFDLGGVTVQVRYCGGPHSDDHLIFFVPEEKFLFLGDASGKELFTLDWDYDPAHPEQLQNILAALPFSQPKLKGFVELLERLDFDRCLFAHADAPWSREELMADLRSHLVL